MKQQQPTGPQASDATGVRAHGRRRRTRRPRVGLLMLVLLVALGSFEVAVRIDDAIAGRDASFYLPPESAKSMYEPHPSLGEVLKPGTSRDQEQYEVHINSLGMRGPEVDVVKPSGVFRVICLGASTTFGSGASSDENTYPARLERLLNHAAETGRTVDGRRYQVLNAGVSGWNSADSLINLELRLLELEPDAVIIYHAANDGRMIQARGFRPDYSHMRRPPPVIELPALERFLLGHVRSYARLVKGTDPEQQFGALASSTFVPGWKNLHVPATTWLNEAGLDVFVRNIGNIILVARGHGIEPVLSTFAVRDSSSEGFLGLGPFIAAANRELTELAQRTGCLLVPVAERLDNRQDLFDDWIHFNDRGEAGHAQVVMSTLVQSGSFGLLPPR